MGNRGEEYNKMICESKNVRVVKLSDTKFHCCNDYYLYGAEERTKWKFCPFCGHKVSTL